MFFSVLVLSIFLSNYAQVGHADHFNKFRRAAGHSFEISFDRFPRYDDIMSYIEKLAKKYSNIVRILDIGNSYEGRPIPCIRISSDLSQRKRPTIFMDAGIHAREWITIPVALYTIQQLVENATMSNMISKVDWLIIPLLNPDGYEYSHTKDRLWRKNRAKGERCHGVDLNRNFDFHWMEKDSSKNECSEIYAGPKPFSEPESRSFFYIATKFKHQIKLYTSLHSYGPQIMPPFGYTPSIKPRNADEALYVANKFVSAVKKFRGSVYKSGPAYDEYGMVSGVSDDWAKGVLKIPLVYTIEIIQEGKTEFEPPPTAILPIVLETFQGFRIMHKYVEHKWGEKHRTRKLTKNN